MRKSTGSKINVLDGVGNHYDCILSKRFKDHCVLSIEGSTQFEKPSFELGIAIAPTKNMSRFEWFLEKAVEMGIQHIYPITTKNSERKTIRLDRLKKIVLSAIKQSKQAWLPKLHELSSLSDFLNLKLEGTKLVAHYGPDLKHIKHQINTSNNTTILIGPEGDFHEKEIGKIIANNWTQVHLGHNRLRTETAGIYACSAFHFVNE